MRSVFLLSAIFLVTCALLRLIQENAITMVIIEIVPQIHPEVAVTTTRSHLDMPHTPVECQDMGFANNNTNATTDQKPVLIAGYPGSGNDLSRTLVERLTGWDGNDIYTSHGNCSAEQRAATCKTHYPMNKDYPVDAIPEQFAPSVVLLIRNPAHAIHSLFNFFWELEHNATDHSQQGSEEEWITWRDEQFDYQIEQWSQLLVYWLHHWDVATVLPFEQLIHPETGPLLVQQLARHLESSGFRTATDAVHCQWYDAVVQSARVQRAPHRYVPSYRARQQRNLLRAVQRSRRRCAQHPVLGPVLQQYAMAIRNLRVVG